MNPLHLLTLTVGLTLLASFQSVAHAANLNYIGTHPDLGPGWRTPTVGKPFDLDGDIVIGTDGYHLANLAPLWPSYLASTEILTGTYPGNGGYASIDDPTALPAVFLTGTIDAQSGIGASADLFKFTLGATAVGRTIRVGLLVDNLDNAAFNPASLTLVQTNGAGASSGPVGTASAPFDNRTPDWIYFEITNGAPGDVFLVRGTGGVAANATLGAVAFDSVANITPQANFTLQAEFPATNYEPNNPRGWGQAAASGDTVVVGNQYLNKAFIYVRDGANWVFQAELTGHNTETNDSFGDAVAIYGNTVIVGARGEASSANTINSQGGGDNSTDNAGAAYVFVRVGTNWIQQAYLKASDNAGTNYFGGSVTLFGDTAIVGMSNPQMPPTVGPQNQSSANGGVGAAYVFVRNGTNWTQQARLTPAIGAGPSFSRSLGLFEDTLVAGYPLKNNGTGGVVVFIRQGNSWSEQADLTITNSAATIGDLFGWSVGISGNTIVAGAPKEDSLGTSDNEWGNDLGASYVFVRSGTNWTQQAFLKTPEASVQGSVLGRTVGISGDTIVLGGLYGNYVFQRAGTNWVRQANLLDGSITSINARGNSHGVSISGGTALIYQLSKLGIYSSAGPRLVVEDAAGQTQSYGSGSGEMAIQDGQPQDLAFTVRNTGTATLSNIVINVGGPDAARFSIPTPPATTVPAGSSTTFTVRFASGAGPYPKSAVLQLASSDAAQSPYILNLTGYNLLSTADADADGLHDVAEFRLSALGFDPFVNQTAMVNALNQAGLYGPAQLQALTVGTPVLSQIAPGQFKLTLGVQKATQLTNFVPFPMAAPQTSINSQGQLEFLFASPDSAEFYRLEAK